MDSSQLSLQTWSAPGKSVQSSVGTFTASCRLRFCRLVLSLGGNVFVYRVSHGVARLLGSR